MSDRHPSSHRLAGHHDFFAVALTPHHGSESESLNQPRPPTPKHPGRHRRPVKNTPVIRPHGQSGGYPWGVEFIARRFDSNDASQGAPVSVCSVAQSTGHHRSPNRNGSFRRQLLTAQLCPMSCALVTCPLGQAMDTCGWAGYLATRVGIETSSLLGQNRSGQIIVVYWGRS